LQFVDASEIPGSMTLFNLAPLAGRGRIASKDAIRVRGYRCFGNLICRERPLTPTL